MQREISDKNTLGNTLNPINDARRSTSIDKTTSNYNDAKEKAQKIRDLITTSYLFCMGSISISLSNAKTSAFRLPKNNTKNTPF